MNDYYLVWLDLEMTGLDEENCAILQTAMIITDMKLNELAELDIAIWQPASTLETMIPLVREMHTKNGLLERVKNSKNSVQQAQIQLMELLTKYVPYRKGHLAGNSMFIDRRFLQKYMPVFEGYLHYRQLDVSSFKIGVQNWFPKSAQYQKPTTTHIALDDIRGSIAELKFYKENCLRIN